MDERVMALWTPDDMDPLEEHLLRQEIEHLRAENERLTEQLAAYQNEARAREAGEQ